VITEFDQVLVRDPVVAQAYAAGIPLEEIIVFMSKRDAMRVEQLVAAARVASGPSLVKTRTAEGKWAVGHFTPGGSYVNEVVFETEEAADDLVARKSLPRGEGGAG
jgi:hypothetical protein